MPNQHDVARLAGVSSASVSRYLADVPTLTPEVRAKIRVAIEQLGYKVDQLAQTMKTGKSRHIAILAPGTGPYFWEISAVLQAELDHEDYFCTLLYSRPQTEGVFQRAEVMETFQRRRLDGALVFPLVTKEDDELLKQLVDWGKPFVIIDRHLEEIPVPQVWINNRSAGRRAAEELLKRGHTDILFLWGDPSAHSANERWIGCSEVYSEAGFPISKERQVNGGYYSQYAWQETNRRWSELPHFTAVFASNDSSALGFIHAARQHGLECPRDFSLVGFDDHAEFAAYTNPPLATFRLPTVALAKTAGKLLLDLLAGRTVKAMRVELEAEFILRDSLVDRR